MTTDLSWGALKSAFIEIGIDPISIEAESYKVSIDLDKITGLVDTKSSDLNVIRFVTKFIEACRVAQTKNNENKLAGQRLAAFPPFTVGAAVNNTVPVTATVVTRYELSSATKIIGNNA